MSNLQSNEKHLADKLRQAPVPDVDRSWEQMRELLDREMPEAAAAGWAGNKRWWWMGITAALIMAALWLTQQLNERDQKGVAVKQSAGKQAAVTSTGKEQTEGSDNTKGTTSNNKSSNNSSGNTSINTTNTTEQETTAPSSTPSENTGVETSAATAANARPSEASPKNVSGQQEAAKRIFAGKNKYHTVKSGARETLAYTPAPYTRKQQTNQAAPVTSNKSDRNSKEYTKHTNAGGIVTFDVEAKEALTSAREARTAFVAGIEQARSKLTPSDEFESPAIAAYHAMAVSGKTDKAYLKQLRKKMIKEDNRRMSKAGMRGSFGDDGRDITFAAGITLPQSFALGQQQSSAYSVSGKTSRFMDYLPAPFFQYHLNNKLFLQTELHFQSPQYTSRLLLASSSTQPATNVRLEKNVYLEKLYYFNIPFNVYYTPAKNFAVGTGLQYSSLLSGVASFEERRVEGQTTSGYQSVTRRFKDDSVAAKFAPSEWRYQFDANYYFKRFTLGLRYNQALRDFVDLPAAPGLPSTQDRNKSFLLYLRFNIWEERKKE